MKGYIRVASIMPNIKVANPKANIESIKEEILKANTLGVKFCVLPELSITSNSLQSLYRDSNILNEALQALYSLILFSNELDIVIVTSLPILFNGRVYEVAAVIKSGKILGLVPKTNFDNNDINKDYFETNIVHNAIITLNDYDRNIVYNVPISKNLTFENKLFKFSVCFNERFDNCPNAEIIANITSIPETIFVDTKLLAIKNFSEKNNVAIISSSQGPSESSINHSYFGRSTINESGDIIAKNDIITNHILIADIDLDRISYFNNYSKIVNSVNIAFEYDNYIAYPFTEKLHREFNKHPYINKKINPYNYSMHILNILAIALAKRMTSINAKTIVIGLSGGLDSAIALLIAKKTIEYMSYPRESIIVCSLPCFGTTNNSSNNTRDLVKSLDLDLREINISNSVTLHLNDIGHDINNVNVTFENAQARERTQVLMDIANDNSGIVLGTGDLSEIAIGFSTYNGDQMSMYNINASLPKTLIKYILNSIAEENINTKNNILLANTLKNILHTPISPELLPTENGLLLQKTEDLIGSYDIHDFVLYYYLKYHYDIPKLNDLAIRTFVYNTNDHIFTDDYVKNCINIFFSRFYKAQYKRVASPDSVDIGLPNLNSSFSFKMPSDSEINTTI